MENEIVSSTLPIGQIHEMYKFKFFEEFFQSFK
jgi:hypothetical protein